jgi:hypothetical protein
MREYGKVFSRIWESPNFRALSEDGRTLALYLLTCQHGTIAGLFRVPDGYASEDLQWSSERVAEGFGNLEANGFATRCDVTKWVWITKYLQHNPPENPNQGKAIRRVVEMVPAACRWLARFHREIGPSIGLAEVPDPPAPTEPFPNPSGTLSESGTGTGTGVNTKQPTVAPALPPEGRPPLALVEPPVPKPAGPPDCPHLAILALWAEVLPALPQHLPSQWRGTRAGHLRARWRETAVEKGWKTEAEGLAYLRKLFGYVGQSRFLTGRARTVGDKPPFVAELAWLVMPQNWAKTIEGKYHSEAA